MTSKEDTRKRYDIKCPYCSSALQACRSVGMELGIMDEGVGKCCHCHKQFLLRYDSAEDTLHARKDSRLNIEEGKKND